MHVQHAYMPETFCCVHGRERCFLFPRVPDTLFWRSSLRSDLFLNCAIVVQVTLGRGGVERLEVYSAPMRVPITLQLKSPRIHLPADVYFQRFHTWHYSCTVSGTPLLRTYPSLFMALTLRTVNIDCLCLL